MSVVNPPSLATAVEILRSGEILALPTETVYGLAARIDSESGIKKIFTTKKRPFFDPLIVHVSDLLQAKNLTTWWPLACDVLAADFWPGPLTLVLPKADLVSDLITSGLTNVGIRMPAHELALELISKVGVPLAAPSANKFGRTSPTSAKHVIEEFEGGVPVLDGGSCTIGIESTVLLIKRLPNSQDTVALSILREGSINKTQLQNSLEKRNIQFEFVPTESKIESPGQMKHHYMPSVPLVLCKVEPESENWLKSEIQKRIYDLPDKIEEVEIIRPKKIERLNRMILPDTPELAARELYSELRRSSQSNIDVIYYILPPQIETDSWSAVRDRLFKAASIQI